MSTFTPYIPDWFDTRKASQVTAFFAKMAGGSINILRVTKLVYLADRLSMQERDHPITGDNFVAMRFGPVNTYTYSYMKGQAAVRINEWSEFIGSERWHQLPLAKEIELDELDELSRADLKVLYDTWNTFKDTTDQFELAEFTHIHCPEWRDPNGSSIPIEFSTVFKRLNKTDPIELAEQIQAERALAASLHSE
jgi:uncharacterized phage-associated protein